MPHSQPQLNALKNHIDPLIDLPCWGVRQGYGSFLTFEFGEPRLEVYERHREGRLHRQAFVTGQWHLWIYCCHWRILQDEAQLAWSEDDRDVIERATGRINGQKLLDVAISPEDGRSTFMFDLGGSLETWPYGKDSTDEQWSIMAITDTVSYRADGLYSHHSNDTPCTQVEWHPLR